MNKLRLIPKFQNPFGTIDYPIYDSNIQNKANQAQLIDSNANWLKGYLDNGVTGLKSIPDRITNYLGNIVEDISRPFGTEEGRRMSQALRANGKYIDENNKTHYTPNQFVVNPMIFSIAPNSKVITLKQALDDSKGLDFFGWLNKSKAHYRLQNPTNNSFSSFVQSGDGAIVKVPNYLRDIVSERVPTYTVGRANQIARKPNTKKLLSKQTTQNPQSLQGQTYKPGTRIKLTKKDTGETIMYEADENGILHQMDAIAIERENNQAQNLIDKMNDNTPKQTITNAAKERVSRYINNDSAPDKAKNYTGVGRPKLGEERSSLLLKAEKYMTSQEKRKRLNLNKSVDKGTIGAKDKLKKFEDEMLDKYIYSRYDSPRRLTPYNIDDYIIDGRLNIPQIQTMIQEGRNDALDFLSSNIHTNTYLRNKRLAERLGYSFGDNPMQGFNRASVNPQSNLRLVMSDELPFAGRTEIYRNPTNDKVILNLASDPSSSMFHEMLHRGSYGVDPKTIHIQNKAPAKDMNGFYQRLQNKIIKPQYQESFTTDFGELPVHLLEIGREMNIKPGSPYPGDQQLLQMLNEFTQTHRGYDQLLNMLNLDDMKSIWRSLNGTLFSQVNTKQNNINIT